LLRRGKKETKSPVSSTQGGERVQGGSERNKKTNRLLQNNGGDGRRTTRKRKKLINNTAKKIWADTVKRRKVGGYKK